MAIGAMTGGPIATVITTVTVRIVIAGLAVTVNPRSQSFTRRTDWFSGFFGGGRSGNEGGLALSNLEGVVLNLCPLTNPDPGLDSKWLTWT